jgi:chromosome segregation ATPase
MPSVIDHQGELTCEQAIAAADIDETEVDRLRRENEELRAALVEAREAAGQPQGDSEQWAERKKEYESLLEEKSDVIRELHKKIRHMEEDLGDDAPREEELIALSEELERERKQLKDDEESLMKQMREMEVQMSRERAEMARQRADLQRLHSELRHELDLAQRDASLRERLAPLQRRSQEVMNRRGAAPTAVLSEATPLSPTKGPPAQPKKDSGLIRRLFG